VNRMDYFTIMLFGGIIIFGFLGAFLSRKYKEKYLAENRWNRV